MGEYAEYNNNRIKIGTCDSMYYLRYEDRFKVKPVKGSLNPATEMDLFWRLPFPDEDDIEPGSYEQYNRGALLVDFRDEETVENSGTIQLIHKNGLMINASCFHGMKLPEESKDLRSFWNGATSHNFELLSIKNTKEGIRPIVGCRWCNEMWRYQWSDVLDHIYDQELRKRLGEDQI